MLGIWTEAKALASVQIPSILRKVSSYPIRQIVDLVPEHLRATIEPLIPSSKWYKMGLFDSWSMG
jgi:hypothetical protein